MTIPSTTYYKIGLVLLLVCLGGFIFRGCSHDNNNTQTINDLHQQVDNLNKQEKDYQSAIDAKSTLVSLLNDSIKQINKKVEVTDYKLQASQSTVLSLSKQVRIDKITKDTTQYYVHCDSLVDQVDSLIDLQVISKRENDALKSLYIQSSIQRDSIVGEQKEMYSNLRNSYNASVKGQETLLKDNIKMEKKVARARTWTRILAGVAAAFAGYSLIK